MDVVYYFDEDLDLCPVKRYFEGFVAKRDDKDSVKDHKKSIMSNIDQKIQYVKENPTNLAAGFIGSMRGYNFLEIKSRKDSKILIRILYYRHESQIVLLNAFEKPSNYHNQKDKKDIEREYEKTDNYLKKFLNNPSNYEKYA